MRDRAAFVITFTKEAAAADSRGDLKTLLACFRRLGKLKVGPLPVLLDASGVPFGDSGRQDEALQSHSQA